MLHALHSLSCSAGCCKCNLQHATSVQQAARLRLMGHLLISLPVSFAAKPAYQMHRQGVTGVLLDSETAIWVLNQPPLLACIRGRMRKLTALTNLSVYYDLTSPESFGESVRGLAAVTQLRRLKLVHVSQKIHAASLLPLTRLTALTDLWVAWYMTTSTQTF